MPLWHALHKKFTYYAGIMLDAFTILLCTKLCWHNWLRPTNKASGPDNIGPRILKNCAAPLTTPVHHLFMLSLNSHSIPGDWKQHTIIPVYKSGDKLEYSEEL